MIGCLLLLNQTIDLVAHAHVTMRTHPGRAVSVFGAAFFLLCAPVQAAEILRDGDTVLRWDNTLKYSAAFRVHSPDAALIADVNSDDGNRSFQPGLISNRFDILSELGLRVGSVGV